MIKSVLNKRSSIIWKILNIIIVTISIVILLLVLWNILKPEMIFLSVFMYSIFAVMTLLGIKNLNISMLIFSYVMYSFVVTATIETQKYPIKLIDIIKVSIPGGLMGLVMSSLFIYVNKNN